MSKITESLTKLFNQHRVVFWYDAKQELREEYENISIEGIKKVEGEKNPFEIKVSIYQDSNQKFLFYFPYEKPSNESNWLLDMELAYHVFQTDQEALYLQELELDYAYKSLISENIQFFSHAGHIPWQLLRPLVSSSQPFRRYDHDLNARRPH